MHAAVWGLMALVGVGCLSPRPPDAFSPAAMLPAEDGWTPRMAVRLGPRMTQAALPLLITRFSPTAPLYLRHLDMLYVRVYESDGAAQTASFAPTDATDVVLRLRDETSTIVLVKPKAPRAPLDRFYLFIDDNDQRIVAYAEGDFMGLLRQAFADSF